MDEPFSLEETNYIFPVEDGAELYRIHITDPLAALPLEEREQSQMAIVFGEGIPVQGYPVGPVLDTMIGAVEAVVKVYQDADLLR